MTFRGYSSLVPSDQHPTLLLFVLLCHTEKYYRLSPQAILLSVSIANLVRLICVLIVSATGPGTLTLSLAQCFDHFFYSSCVLLCSCHSAVREESLFWRFEAVMMSLAVFFILVVVKRQQVLDRRASERVWKQLQSS